MPVAVCNGKCNSARKINPQSEIYYPASVQKTAADAIDNNNKYVLKLEDAKRFPYR